MSFGATIVAAATAISAEAFAGSNAAIAAVNGSEAAPVVRPVLRNVRRLSIESSLIPPGMKVYLLAWPLH
jgi:hypothetical protein